MTDSGFNVLPWHFEIQFTVREDNDESVLR